MKTIKEILPALLFILFSAVIGSILDDHYGIDEINRNHTEIKK